MDGFSDTLSNPLGESREQSVFVDPSVAQADAELRAEHAAMFSQAPDAASGPTGTAITVTKAVDQACAAFLGAGLTESEAAELERALLPVLIKRNVPNIPWAEEINLAMTVGGIIVPRVRAKIEAAREAEEQEAQHDSSGRRQEGLPQERAIADNGFPSFGSRTAETDRIL